MKYIYKMLGVFLLTNNLLSGQVGIGTKTPLEQAVLQVQPISNNKGVVMPHVSLSATNVATIDSPVKGLLVYNIATTTGTNLVTPGYYSWDGAKWVRLGNEDYNLRVYETALDKERRLGYELKGYNEVTRPAGLNGLSYTSLGCESWSGNGHYYCAYRLNDTVNGVSWEGAHNFAKSIGGYLVTITNNDERTFITNTFLNSAVTKYNLTHNIWLGFNKAYFAGNGTNLRWITGEVSRRDWSNNTETQAYFNDGEPNNSGGTEGCAHIWQIGNASGSRRWNDLSCSLWYAGDISTGKPYTFSEFIIEFDR